MDQNIKANERECAALAQRFDLVGISKLEAQLKIAPEGGGMNFTVSGNLEADLVQSCVVTLEPLPAHIKQSIKVHYAPAEAMGAGAAERATDEDDMEVIENGIIDLGELVAQHFGLALDPYPRKAGLPPVEAVFGEPVKTTSPFAKLVDLKKKTEE